MSNTYTDLIETVDIFFPHIAQKIEEYWDYPEKFNPYMESIIFQNRKLLREGFPVFIFNCIDSLYELNKSKNQSKIDIDF